nr:MAG: hypothetical protein 1 [Regressovirinae sp.]
MVFSIISFDVLLRWLSNNVTFNKLSQFQNFVLKQGKNYWMSFKSWFWGLNCDLHEKLVRKIVPVMPVIDDEFDRLEARVEAICDAENLSECLEIDLSENAEFNESWETKDDGSDADAVKALKAKRKQTHKIKEFFMLKACKAVELQLRTKHGVVPGNELNEHALRMSAQEICAFYSINKIDTYILCNRPVMMAMIPDQTQMDALRVIYNQETSGRRATVEALRNSEAYSHFKSGHYA